MRLQSEPVDLRRERRVLYSTSCMLVGCLVYFQIHEQSRQTNYFPELTNSHRIRFITVTFKSVITKTCKHTMNNNVFRYNYAS